MGSNMKIIVTRKGQEKCFLVLGVGHTFKKAKEEKVIKYC